MNYRNDKNFIKIRISRNLIIISFYSLKNSSELLSFFVCQDDFNRVNNFLYKAKTRFETLKGVLETAPKSIKDDMANALILSFKDYYSAIREVVDRQNWCFQEFEDTNSEFIN
ncbi:hypothetical protein, partial [Vreelandella alkaliphila]|uniref:hypothetical protein n=1 Tax=Vreelandella alkaliphila TaxID=272774 RepID=UPI001EE3C121